jgi:hypothetical protein
MQGGQNIYNSKVLKCIWILLWLRSKARFVSNSKNTFLTIRKKICYVVEKVYRKNFVTEKGRVSLVPFKNFDEMVN